MFGQVLVDRAKLAARLANCLVDRLACLADATHHVAQNGAKSDTLICANMRRYAPICAGHMRRICAQKTSNPSTKCAPSKTRGNGILARRHIEDRSNVDAFVRDNMPCS